MFFSKETGGFYDEKIHGKGIPDDAVYLSNDKYNSIIAGQSNGFVISCDSSGNPILVKNEAEVLIPTYVYRSQGKSALIRMGMWQRVISYINSIEDDTDRALAEVALNDTVIWQRSSPFLNSAAQALGLTDEQLDQLFIDASKIEL